MTWDIGDKHPRARKDPHAQRSQMPPMHDIGGGAPLCGPECRYRSLYESGQESLRDLAAKHQEAVSDYKTLREGIISIAKRSFGGEVREVERRSGERFTNADDEALLIYLEGFIRDSQAHSRVKRRGMDTLRAALEQAGFELPDSHNPEDWAAAIRIQRPQTPGSYPATTELATDSVDEIDLALRELLEASTPPPSAPKPKPKPAEAPTPPPTEQSEPEPDTGGDAQPADEGGELADLFGDVEIQDWRNDIGITPEGGGESGLIDIFGDALPTSEPTAAPEPVPELDEHDQPSEDHLTERAATANEGAGETDFDIDLAVAPELEEDSEDELDFELPDADDFLADLDGLEVEEPNPNEADIDGLEDLDEIGVDPTTLLGGTDEKEDDAAERLDRAEIPADDDELADLLDGVDSGFDATLDLEAEEPPAAADELAGGDDLADLFADISEPTEESTDHSPAADGRQAPKPAPVNPAFLTPEEAAAAGQRLRPEITPQVEPAKRYEPQPSRKPEAPRARKAKAQRPENLRFDVPTVANAGGGQLSEEVHRICLEAVEVPRPVFITDLGAKLGDRAIAEAWESEMRSANNPPVRFTSPRKRHQDLGSLIRPDKFLRNAPADFTKTWWGEILERHRSNSLYELGVLGRAIGDYIVGYEVEDEYVTFRTNMPHGLSGIVVVIGDDLGEGGETRKAVADAVERLTKERLAAIMVLPVRHGRDDQVAEMLLEEGRARSWKPAMPIAVSPSWDYVKYRGDKAKVVFGGRTDL